MKKKKTKKQKLNKGIMMHLIVGVIILYFIEKYYPLKKHSLYSPFSIQKVVKYLYLGQNVFVHFCTLLCAFVYVQYLDTVHIIKVYLIRYSDVKPAFCKGRKRARARAHT